MHEHTKYLLLTTRVRQVDIVLPWAYSSLSEKVFLARTDDMHRIRVIIIIIIIIVQTVVGTIVGDAKTTERHPSPLDASAADRRRRRLFYGFHYRPHYNYYYSWRYCPERLIIIYRPREQQTYSSSFPRPPLRRRPDTTVVK